MPNRRQSCLWLGLAGTVGKSEVLSVEPPRFELQMLSHYEYPPFVTGPGQGLSHELAAWLAQRPGADLRSLRLQVLPRKRLDLFMLEPGWSGFVPWVLPAWFADAGMSRHIWSEPVLDDEDLVLSLRSKPLEFDGPASLKGLRLGSVTGHIYEDVAPLIASGAIKREDAPSTESNLRKLLLGRVDAIFLSRSGLPWWMSKIPEMSRLVYVAQQPRQRFQRRILISAHTAPELRRHLLDSFAAMASDPQWQIALRNYGLASTRATLHALV